MILDRVTKEEIPGLTTDKVSKDELEQLLPNMELFEMKMIDIIGDKIRD